MDSPRVDERDRTTDDAGSTSLLASLRAGAAAESIGLVDLAALAVVFLMPMVSLGTPFGESTVRLSLLLLVLPVGLAATVQAARAGERTAWCVLATCGVVLLAAAVARHPAPAFFGDIDSRSSAIVTVGYLACWGLGRRFRARAGVLELAFLGGVGIQLVTIIVQGAINAESRPSALASNSIFAGALFAAAIAVPTARARLTRDGAAWFVPVLLLGYGIGIAGSRVALAGAAVAIVLAAVRRPKVVVIALLLLAVGQGAAGHTSTSSAGSRLASDASGGLTPRKEMWKAGVHAWEHRPLLGWGPGRFLEATSSRVTLTFMGGTHPNERYGEAHNLFVEALTTTGILGLLALLAVLARALWYGRGTARAIAAGLLMSHMLEPQSLVITPAMFVFLGLSARAVAKGPPLPPLRRPAAAVVAAGTVLALVASGLVLGCDLALQRANDDVAGGLHASQQAADLVPVWATPKNSITVALLLGAHERTPSAADARKATAAADRALALDPTRPELQYYRALIELRFGDPHRALAMFEAADRNAPWYPQILDAMRGAARKVHDTAAARAAQERICKIVPTMSYC